jgi:hypothetical protein
MEICARWLDKGCLSIGIKGRWRHHLVVVRWAPDHWLREYRRISNDSTICGLDWCRSFTDASRLGTCGNQTGIQQWQGRRFSEVDFVLISPYVPLLDA